MMGMSHQCKVRRTIPLLRKFCLPPVGKSVLLLAESKLSYNYDSNVELVCYHDEELDKWGWITNPSASDEDESSSSTAESSSSEIKIVMAEPCRDDTEDNCEYDTLEDERDGESYKTVKIGPQEWMTENLRYEGEERMQLCLPVLMAGICPLMLTS